MNDQIVIGIDVGGTHLTIAPVNLSKPKVLLHLLQRIEFDSNGNVDEIISNWAIAIQKVADSCSLLEIKIGLAFPGPFDYENGICLIRNQNKYEKFYSNNIRHLLAKSLQIDPENICFMNDAACFLKGELFMNPVNHPIKALGITLGTGLGTSRTHNNQVIDAEFWKMPFKSGIAEDYLSTKWFLEKYYSLAGKRIYSVLEISKNVSSLNEVEQRICAEIFGEFGINLGDFLCAIFPLVRQDLIIIGGNIAKSIMHFENSLNETLLAKGYKMTFQRSTLGEEAAIMGAASLCLTQCVY